MAATPENALAKVVEARKKIAEGIALLGDARAICAEQTNGSTRSGLPDIEAALYWLVGDDAEVEQVLGHLDAILAMNGRASEVWS